MKTKLLFLLTVVFLASCTKDKLTIEDPIQISTIESQTPQMEGETEKVMVNFTKGRSASVASKMNAINDALSAQGINFHLSAIEAYGIDGAGSTTFFNDRGNKQLSADFVPFDSRRRSAGESDSNILFARDGTEGITASGLSQTDTDVSILSAMNTWDNVTCSEGLNIINIGATPFDLGYVEAIVSQGAEGAFVFTDIMHSGFNTNVTDAIFGPGSTVLGVTFTFTFNDAEGNPTDIDNNGKGDVAFRDIYYNDSYNWVNQVTGGGQIDVETVVLHETGHALSQAHFGKLFRTESNNKFHFAPRALMNAGYTGVQRTVKSTDKAGHCSNWSSWPGN